jgi:3-oxoacyl-[acyl-carrier protein] reductase
MIARRSGCIISISSVAGLTGTPTHVHYSAAKGGIVAFTKALAKEVGQYGITVNAVAPGMVETGFGGGAPEPIKRLFMEKTVLGRIGKPQEIAAACLYLASEDGSYITGQVLSPNGGYFI